MYTVLNAHTCHSHDFFFTEGTLLGTVISYVHVCLFVCTTANSSLLIYNLSKQSNLKFLSNNSTCPSVHIVIKKMKKKPSWGFMLFFVPLCSCCFFSTSFSINPGFCSTSLRIICAVLI